MDYRIYISKNGRILTLKVKILPLNKVFSHNKHRMMNVMKRLSSQIA